MVGMRSTRPLGSPHLSSSSSFSPFLDEPHSWILFSPVTLPPTDQVGRRAGMESRETHAGTSWGGSFSTLPPLLSIRPHDRRPSKAPRYAQGGLNPAPRTTTAVNTSSVPRLSSQFHEGGGRLVPSPNHVSSNPTIKIHVSRAFSLGRKRTIT